jgi:tetratricopeptide (TPR) repeat protein
LDPGEDKAYAVLIQYPPEQVLPFLDQLYARDRFEERPLIWKATILLRQGKLDEAETTIRLALKIDPTDGEQPPGDRVRSYAVLAEILAAKGKTDDAAFFRNVVKSVRIAEEGDRLAGVGLTTRSLQRYAEAETLFADAYCVQWRLAERLRETGKIAEAQKHYQIAFERMPEQFGQMASLCFGCMGVFDSPDSRGAAETVLTRLAAQPPVRPTVHYLLGQLREAQERYNEAYAEYKKAVELDSNYLDAQEKMYGLRNKINLPPEEWSAIELRLLRMDPLNRHGSVRLEEMGDLKGFWAARTEALPLDFPWVHDLLPLTANQKAQEVAKEDDFREQHFRGYSESKARIVPPGDVIAQHKLVENLNRIQSAWELAQPEADSPFDF